MNHIREHRFFLCFLVSLLILVCFALAADAQQFIVRTVYFQPTDAPAPSNSKIVRLLIQSQDFYRAEMERHGYGTKTFKLETTPDGYVGFHHVRGKHNASHYLADTYNRIKSELHPTLTLPRYARDNVLVIIVSGIKILNTGDKAYGGYYLGDNTGGFVIIVNDVLNFENLAHEIGHTFGLNHTNDPDPDAIMYTGSKYLLDYEARWLDRHPFFNDTHIRNGVPLVVESLPIIAIGTDKLRFKFVAESKTGFYQAQLTRLKSQSRWDILIGNVEVEGHATTIQLDVDRIDLRNGDGVGIQIMDIYGNKTRETVDNIILPLPITVDINADGVVNIQDLVLVAARLGEMWEGAEDVNRDGVVNILDLVLVANAF